MVADFFSGRSWRRACACMLAGPLMVASCQTQTASLSQLEAAAGAPRKESLELPPSGVVAKAEEAGPSGEGPDTSLVTGSVGKTEGDAGKPATEVVERYEPPKAGTVLAWRNNWASLPPLITYKVDGSVKIGNADYIKFTSVAGLKRTTHAYYTADGYALKGYRDAADKALVTFKPVEERYRFPMKPGDKWVAQWKSFDHEKKQESRGGGVVEVIGFETLDLAFGKVRALKVRLPVQSNEPIRHHVWFAPSLGVTVKETITNGKGVWSQVLEDVRQPG